ncbi:protein of unknown function [Modestobacter italicus]|uniref:Uncharacterized protein n=1 Tax=Modestobacter italicus (strain DSM 44449 / CECT 9708 / BC 501) TaxID=2732864 RepID=I4F1N0_MODI5|nr:protein of unknown function [Modestobacter marinus]
MTRFACTPPAHPSEVLGAIRIATGLPAKAKSVISIEVVSILAPA